ncbi:MAG TPA: phosphoribosylformylglycinamidine synthase subunit PurQ [Armatimonadota bacterium]|jgi:phosphoribosylformylglycinamidine synthase
MKFGVVQFPGSNCDADCYDAISAVTGQDVRYVWHEETDLSDLDCVVLPGGFSYGDYLRCGAVARFSPVMKSIIDHANKGRFVIGICNGFQVLTEAGLLPGALYRNDHLKFICQPQYLRIERTDLPFTHFYQKGQVVNFPIAHGEGRYYADPELLAQLEENGQVIFRYCTAAGEVTPDVNPNGSLNNIAGICNERGNVLGLMPHPERRCDRLLGGTDGKKLFKSLMESLKVNAISMGRR